MTDNDAVIAADSSVGEAVRLSMAQAKSDKKA